MFLYFLRNKGEGTEKLIEFIQWAEKQSGCQVKNFRSDRGGEFVDKKLQDFAKKKGFNLQQSIPYTPEQNGLVKQANRTLVDAARASLHGAMKTSELTKEYPKLGLNLWAEALNYQ